MGGPGAGPPTPGPRGAPPARPSSLSRRRRTRLPPRSRRCRGRPPRRTRGHRLGCVPAVAARTRGRAGRDAAAPPERPGRGDRQVDRRAPREGRGRRHVRVQVAHRGHAGPSPSGSQVEDAADRPDGGDRAWEVAAHRVGPGRRAPAGRRGRVAAHGPMRSMERGYPTKVHYPGCPSSASQTSWPRGIRAHLLARHRQEARTRVRSRTRKSAPRPFLGRNLCADHAQRPLRR